MSPIFPQLWKDLSQSIRLGYYSVNIRNADLVIPVPQVNGTGTAAGALILGGDTEHNIIWAVVEIQFCLL